MKIVMIMATAFALSNSAALSQTGSTGQSGASVGSVVAPSVGSYYWPSVGSTAAVPTWSNTNPPEPNRTAPTIGSAPSSSQVRR